jgi:hypothetical protein
MLNTFYLIITSEGRSQGRMKERRHKRCCIRQYQESTLTCEEKKMTKPKNKSTLKPRMVEKWGPQDCNTHKERWSGEKRRSLAIDYKRSALREATCSSSQE